MKPFKSFDFFNIFYVLIIVLIVFLFIAGLGLIITTNCTLKDEGKTMIEYAGEKARKVKDEFNKGYISPKDSLTIRLLPGHAVVDTIYYYPN